jgi:predicted dehydrogenase
LRALVVGLGSIGRRHVENLRRQVDDVQIVALRRSESPPEGGVDRVVTSWDAALENPPDIALITSPANLHVDHAIRAAEAGAHLFIEKPLSDRLDAIAELRRVLETHQRLALVGYQFRFYEPLVAAREALRQGRIGRLLSLRAQVGMYLPDWRPGTDYRESVSARQKLGGGALLELSHELDLARWFGGEVSQLTAMADQLTDLEIDVEDVAEVLLRYESGAIGSVHVDMAQRVPHRSLKLVGTEGTLTWSWSTHETRLWTVDDQQWVTVFDAADERNTMYEREMEHFLDCVRSGSRPDVGLDDGEGALRLALAARAAAAEQQWVTP